MTWSILCKLLFTALYLQNIFYIFDYYSNLYMMQMTKQNNTVQCNKEWIPDEYKTDVIKRTIEILLSNTSILQQITFFNSSVAIVRQSKSRKNFETMHSVSSSIIQFIFNILMEQRFFINIAFRLELICQSYFENWSAISSIHYRNSPCIV